MFLAGFGTILFGLANSTGRNQMLMPNNLFEERHPSRIVPLTGERDRSGMLSQKGQHSGVL